MSVPTLYDVPVSNNGARCRIIIYKKVAPLPELNHIHLQNIPSRKPSSPTSPDPRRPSPTTKQGLTEQDITIAPPSFLGGLKSPEYLALNPQVSHHHPPRKWLSPS